ncbi:Ig-like domain repeat protein [Tardiphaga sp. 866_E4_N2_1]|uniref:Ig-like domain repeat protein n=1 Tax=unclassified Tardiphaga TaxID=2631404 RepID=UPI003F21C4B0
MFGRILGSIKLAALIVFAFLAVSTSASASPPTAAVAVAPNQLAYGQTATVTITFSEAVTGFGIGDLTVDNGSLSGLATSDNITYTTTLTAVSGITAATNHVVLDLSGTVNSGSEAGIGTAVSNNYSVGPISQTITFGAQAGRTFVSGGTFAVSPLATTSSGLAVTYSSLTTGVCTVFGGIVTMISAGTCTVAADQAGNGATYAAASQVTQDIIIARVASNITLTASANPSLPGQAVAFTAIVSGSSPTGTVTLMDGATTLGTGVLSGGVVTLIASALTGGTHAITAVYAGDTNNAPATSPVLNQSVNQAGTSIVLVSSANPSTPGQAVTFTATVTSTSGTPTGTVTFMDGTATLGTGTLSSGLATLTTSALISGTHAITAVYGGDTNNTSSTSSALSQAVNQAMTSTVLVSSANPSAPGQAVTFTATVTGGGGTPAGTVSFNDGGAAIGSAILAGGTATLTTSALTAGTHTITAVYAGNGNFKASTSAALLQAVNMPQDSLKLRALQVIATKVVAQNSGAAITGAIDSAISEGFSDGGNLVTPSGAGIRFNFSADPDRPQTATAGADMPDRWNGLYGRSGSGLPGNANGTTQSQLPQGASRVENAFAAIDRSTMPAKAPGLRTVAPKDWLLWADVKGSGIARWGSSTLAPILYGSQVNALMGLTRRVTPNFLVGAFGGYETFDYRSDALNGHLKGDGWTLGSYLGWRFAPGLRFDAAAAYSGIGYDGTAGTATGSFSGHRWLASSGLTGSYKTYGFDIEPSAKFYALWERENAYTDSLGALQADRTFFTGRASGGIKLSYPWLTSATVMLAPYAGFYADYYFTGDDAAALSLAGTVPLASVPLLDGWSARATGGVAANLGNEAIVALGAEFGGIGSNVQIWTFRGRASVPF